MYKGEPLAVPVPVVPDLHKRVYDAAAQPGALDMNDWHCGTAHCWAGHIVNEAGAEGYALEKALDNSTCAAAMLIAKASGAPISPAKFFEFDNDAALEDMRLMAEAEAEGSPASPQSQTPPARPGNSGKRRKPNDRH